MYLKSINYDTFRLVKAKIDGNLGRMSEVKKVPARGRPRSDATKFAIYKAAVELCSESGFQQMTIDGVAAKAGVGRQTIYRWWPDLASLLFEALTELAAKEVAPLDEAELGSIRPDAFIRRTFQVAKKHRFALSKMMALAQLDENSKAALRSQFIDRRRRIAHKILFPTIKDSGKTDFFLDLFFGTVWYGLLVREEALQATMADQMVELYKRFP